MQRENLKVRAIHRLVEPWLFMLLILGFCPLANGVGLAEEVPNFALLDIHGRYHEFHRESAGALVLFFTGNGCPIARQYLQKLKRIRQKFPENEVAIWVVNSNHKDSRGSIYDEASELKANWTFPFLRDETQGVARMLGISRTAAVVAISTKNRRIFYHGAVDDQLTEGASRTQAQNHYLENALQDFLAGKPARETNSTVHGCLINFESQFKAMEISYAREVAPVLEKHCVPCHSAGNIGSFAMSNYDKVKSRADMIQEVILSRRMPPWSADTEAGHYAGERTMTLEETRTLLAWVQQGAKRGEGDDSLQNIKASPPEYWPLGKPDFIVALEKETIPATGVLEYRHIKVPAPVEEDSWLSGVAVHPGNRKVVHHCIVRASYPNAPDDGSGLGSWLQGWAPGISIQRFPEGTGRLLPKGATLDIEIHYTTTGSEQQDQTEIGFYKLSSKPPMVLDNVGAYNQEFSILPGQRDSQTFGAYCVRAESRLYSMSPHMHLRGSWMRYEALYPDGKSETLLSVPHYDFNWQTTYRLIEPKVLPAGTWILCSGGFDNSAQNPNNPDPSKRVTWGEQSFDEMFIGFMEIAELPRKKTTAGAGL